MNRRTMLALGAAVIVDAELHELKGQSLSEGVVAPFAVRSGQGRRGGLWLVHGEKAFSTKVSGTDVGKRYAVIEVHTPPGRGPELHVHPEQSEFFYMLEGQIGVQCGTERTILRAGDAFLAPADIPHAYVTLGSKPAHMLLVFNPAGNMESFFAGYAPLVGVDGEPNHTRLAEVYKKNGLRVVGPPLVTSSFSA